MFKSVFYYYIVSDVVILHVVKTVQFSGILMLFIKFLKTKKLLCNVDFFNKYINIKHF